MKILYIINNLGPGGAEKLIEESLLLMNNIEGLKTDLLLLTDKNNVFDKKLKKNGIKVNIIPLKNIYNPFNIFYIRKHIIEGNYDIVHVHLFPTNYWTSLASKLIFKNKPKFIFTEHSTHNKRREKILLKHLEKFIYYSYDKIISVSQKAQDNLISWLKPNQKSLEKFVIIENGINLKNFIDVKPYYKNEINEQFSEDTKLICMIGRFSKAKDQPTLIKAMKKLPPDMHLLLIGEGPLKEKSEVLAKKMGLEHRVHFLGFRNDIYRILKTVDIVVQSSHWEGLPLAAIEGLASGKPLIASNVPGLKEVVLGAGIVFEEGNYEQLGEIIYKLLKNKELYNKVRKECLKKAEAYSLEKMIERYIQIYKEVLEH